MGEIELKDLGTESPSPLLAQSEVDPIESLPSTIFYRTDGIRRPRLQDIRSGNESCDNLKDVARKPHEGGTFGTFDGVFMHCVLNIISSIYYLRLGWVVANLGLLCTLGLIIVCTAATILTTLSLSALVTNGSVKGGGNYYFMSRSLGPKWGGTDGVIEAFSTVFSEVLNVFGFEEAISDLIGHSITTDGKWDIPIIGISLATFLLIVICISLRLEFFMQYLLGAGMIISWVAILFGFIHPSLSWKASNISTNLYPHFQSGQDFFSVLGVFFPAFTGITAGANLSGDLAEPNKSIPIGTIWAILCTSGLYAVTAVILASVGSWDGLANDTNILAKACLWAPLNSVGVVGASISSASASLVGGSKIFQALCRDDMLPHFLSFFGKGKKESDDPIYAFILGWVITVICCFSFKNLDAVSTVVSILFLLAYGLVCLSCLMGRFSYAPSWRPSWKYYHPATAIVGAIICVAGMFMISWIYGLVAVAIAAIIYLYFSFTANNSHNWGEYTTSLLYTETINNLQKLKMIPVHAKTYRPQIEFVLNVKVGDLVSQINEIVAFDVIASQTKSLLSLGTIGGEIPPEIANSPVISNAFIRNWGDIPPALMSKLIGTAGGIGKVSPNILAIPYIEKYRDSTELYDMVGSAFDANLSVAIARGFQPLDSKNVGTKSIDVWWLADDGGLPLLLGYILTRDTHWSKSKINCFCIIHQEDDNQITTQTLKMTKMMDLLRIQAEVRVLSDKDRKPSDASLAKWAEYNVDPGDNEPVKQKVNRLLIMRDLILENSKDASLIVCTMPIPKATQNASPKAWVSLIDSVSSGMPPFVWAHGNNENVLTFMA